MMPHTMSLQKSGVLNMGMNRISIPLKLSQMDKTTPCPQNSEGH